MFDVEIIDVQDLEEVIVKADEKEKDDELEVPDDPLKVADGMTVKMTIAMFDINGNMLELPDDGDVTYVHGAEGSFKLVIEGLQKRLTGLTVGKHDAITLSPEDAYGEKDPDAIEEIDKEEIFTDNLKVGAVLKGIGPEGGDATITEVKDSSVILDFNSPLVGKTLKFNIRIIDIKE